MVELVARVVMTLLPVVELLAQVLAQLELATFAPEPELWAQIETAQVVSQTWELAASPQQQERLLQVARALLPRVAEVQGQARELVAQMTVASERSAVEPLEPGLRAAVVGRTWERVAQYL